MKKPLKSVESDSLASYLLAELYTEMEKFDLAEKYFKLVLEFTDDSEISYLLGNIYEKQNNFGLSIKYYVEANDRISVIEYKFKLLTI